MDTEIEMRSANPEVILFGVSKNPSLAIFGREMGDSEFEHELVDRFFDVLDEPLLPHPLDRVRLSFLLFNVSRALQQQLTRHRVDFSYSIQSLRMVNLGEFAKGKRYTLPSTGTDAERKLFVMCMGFLEDAYKRLSESGSKMSLEDARGILPLNIHSTVSFSVTFRALTGMMAQRLCLATQTEFRSVATQIKRAVTEWNAPLGNRLVSNCSRGLKCQMNRPDCAMVTSGKVALQ